MIAVFHTSWYTCTKEHEKGADPMHQTILYSGPSEKVVRQIASHLRRAGIPFCFSGSGILLKNGHARYRISVRSGDAALAVLILKQHRRKSEP